MSREEFTFQKAINIQDQQLAEWKKKLVPELWDALWEWAKETNDQVTDPNQVRRGTDLDCYIKNWPDHV